MTYLKLPKLSTGAVHEAIHCCWNQYGQAEVSNLGFRERLAESGGSTVGDRGSTVGVGGAMEGLPSKGGIQRAKYSPVWVGERAG